MFYNQEITIYNAYYDKDVGYDKYKRTLIEKAYWEDEIGVKLGNITINEEQSIIVVIPMNTPDYVLPSEFMKDATTGLKWTLREGDYIVKGNHGEIDDYDDIKNLDFVATIQSVETNDQAIIKRLNNFTVTGK